MSTKRKFIDLPSPSQTSPQPHPPLPTSAPPSKRQRVSRACDQCRTAREKCNGAHPQCLSCTFLRRPCTYNVTPKKRGVRTGLIRTLQCALVWLFDECPGAEGRLRGLLERAEGRRMLRGRGAAGLVRRWEEGGVGKAVERMLAGGEEEEGDDLDGEGTTSGGRMIKDNGGSERPISISGPAAAPVTASEDAPVNVESTAEAETETDAADARYRLPSTTLHLLTTYKSYVHCWLPILDLPRLHQLAKITNQPVKDVELWSTLAIASVLDPTVVCRRPPGPEELYETSRSLLPTLGETERPLFPERDLPNMLQKVNGLLILSLASFGKDNVRMGSLLVAFACQMIQTYNTVDRKSPHYLQFCRSSMACLVLDTLACRALRIPTNYDPEAISDYFPLPNDRAGDAEVWAAPSQRAVSGIPTYPANTISTFNQLTRLITHLAKTPCQRIPLHYNPRRPRTPTIHLSSLGYLLQPRFSFCNSIGTPPPATPSAIFLQIVFLTITMLATADTRSSLMWSLMESIEHMQELFASGKPPVLCTIARIIGELPGVREADRQRWVNLRYRLALEWDADRVKSPLVGSPQAPFEVSVEPRGRRGKAMQTQTQADEEAVVMMVTEEEEEEEGPEMYSASTFLPPHVRSIPTGSGTRPYRQIPIVPMAGHDPHRPPQHHHHPSPHHSHQYMALPVAPVHPHAHQPVDHKQTPPVVLHQAQVSDHQSILDELVSINRSEVDADARFMENLGFAPGSGFGDM